MKTQDLKELPIERLVIKESKDKFSDKGVLDSDSET